MNIVNPKEVLETMSNTSYITCAIMADGGRLCYECVCNEQPLLVSEYSNAIKNGFSMNSSDTQWLIIGVDINWEDESLYCSHCNEQIEPSYCD